MNNAEQKVFFQQCIYDALIKLLKKYSLENISIGKLCDTAGVSRMTYYRHFERKEDILLQHLDESFSKYMQSIKTLPKINAYEISLAFFNFWKTEEKEFLLIVFKSGLIPQMIEKFYLYLDETLDIAVPNSDIKPYMKSFLSGGLCKLLFDWIKNDMKDSPEEMSAFLAAGNEALSNAFTKV